MYDIVLTDPAESRAIARYLVQKFGKESTLIPPTSDLIATAKFEAACSIEMANFEKIASEIIAERVFKRSVARNCRLTL